MKAAHQLKLLLATLAWACVLPAASATATSGPAQFQAFLKTTQSARALFTQTVTARSGRKPQYSKGQVAFVRPGRFRWLYELPYYQLLVGDGSKLWIFDRDLNQVTIKQLGSALGSTPAALLAGDNDIERNFVISDAGSVDGLDYIEAMPRNKEEGSFAWVRIGLRNNLPQRMIIQDHFGQQTLLEFQQFERNLSLSAELFRFSPPQGADVIGE